MRFELKEVSICAEKEFELIRITDPVREFVAQTGVKNGVVYVITEHTTTGIMVNESLPCVEKDIMETLDRIAPENYPYHHNHYLPTYGTIGGNAPGHLKSLLTGNHCVFQSQRARSSWAAQRIFISASTMASKTANI